MRKYFIKSILFLMPTIFFHQNSFSAMTDSQVNVIVAYIASSDMMVKLKKSKCGYVIKRTLPTVSSVVSEIKTYLKGEDLNEIISFYNSPEFEVKMKKNDYFIDGFLANSAKDGVDEKTSCGLLLGIVASKDNKAEWEKIKNNIK
jgi:hypothetical protein